MSDLMLDVDQAGELKAAFRRGGWTNAEIKTLSQGDMLKRVRGVVLGLSEIKPVEHLIDCDADPFCPSDWKVEEHKKQGKVKWSQDLVSLWLSKSQKKGVIQGYELRKELANKPALNANVLDFLLKHPHLIPEEPKEWKTKLVFFWGTIYRDSDGHLYVRYLYWGGDRWYWHYYWLGFHFYGDGRPAALRASAN